MNKFSSISGQKVNDIPDLITSREIIKLEALKAGINKLIDNFLTIRSYGSARKNILENTVKISGKEVFIEALIDFMVDKSIEEQIETLESLKVETKDWMAIDNKISELNNLIQENKEFNHNKKQINKIKTLIDTYGNDDIFETILDSMVLKSNDLNESILMSITANKMKSNFKYLNYSKKQLALISEKYGKKAKEISFKQNGFTSR